MSWRTRCLAIPILMLSASASFADDAEQDAVKVVEKLGGSVTRDDKNPDLIIGVSLANSRVTDSDLKKIAALKNLRRLYLALSRVGDPDSQSWWD